MTVAQRSAAVHDLVPLLFVEDIERSLAFYRDQLGFSIAEKWEPEGKIAWCRLVRGGATLMLQQACEEDGPAAGCGRGIGFFFLCDDADAVHIEFLRQWTPARSADRRLLRHEAALLQRPGRV